MPLLRSGIRIQNILLLSIFIYATYVRSAPGNNRSDLVTQHGENNHSKTHDMAMYSFGYDIEEPDTANIQFRNEQRHRNGTVTGSFGYVELDGNIHIEHYVADSGGYRAMIEDSLRSPGTMKMFPSPISGNFVIYGISSTMRAAMQSMKNYQKKKLEDQHTRPVDLFKRVTP